MKTVLIGYMASGKSAVGKQLALKLNQEFIDLDAYIELKEQLSIPQLFEEKGEIYFRKIEGVYLNELLQKEEEFVLSLGGGTPCYGTNLEDIKKHSNSVYLKCTIPRLYQRLIIEKEQRPLVASLSNDDLMEFIGKHLFERAPFYEQADKVIKVETKSIDELVLEITKT